MAENGNTGIGRRDYVRMVRRSLWLIVAVVLVAGVGAYLYSRSRMPMYGATAQLLYQPAIDATASSSSGTYVDPNAQQLQVEGAATVIMGPQVASLVASSLGSTASWPSHSLSASATSAGQTGGTSYSTGVDVSVSSPSPTFAARLANAYAAQFIAWRLKNQRDAYTVAADAVRSQLSSLTTPSQRASSQYSILQQELQVLEVRAATATGDFIIVNPASTSTVPYSPKPARSAMLAAGIGLVLGLGLAFLRDKLDTRVRGHREVGDQLALPVIGRIPTIPHEQLEKRPLVVLEDANSPAANAFRLVRSNLEFVTLGEEERTIMVASALKGEGKSVTIVNLAASIAVSGRRVLLMDADLRRPQVHALLDRSNQRGVSSIIAGRAKLEECIQSVELDGGRAVSRVLVAKSQTRETAADEAAVLSFLPSGPTPPNPGEMIASQRFVSLLRTLKEMPFDYILVDSPAFLSVGDASALAAGVDALLLVVNLKLTRRSVLEEAKEFMTPLPMPMLGVVTVADHLGRDERYAYHSGA